MKIKSFFKNLFTKQNMIGLGRFLLVSATIAGLMSCIESLCIYSLETYRFHLPAGAPKPPFDGGLWAADWGIAFCLAWPLSWVITNAIPKFWQKNVFDKAAAKHGEPNKGQMFGGFVMVTLNIVLWESLIMSLLMYSIDTQALLNDFGMGKQNWVATDWLKDWGSAIGIAFPCAVVITSLVPMGYKKLFARIDRKPNIVDAKKPYLATDLKEKIDYLDDEDDVADSFKNSKKKNEVSK